MKLFILLLFICTISEGNAQTIDLLGKSISFGSSESNLTGSFWQKGNQVESEYPYITIYEYSDSIFSISGLYYKSKLIGVYASVYSNEPLPATEEIENIFKNVGSYKEGIDTTDGSLFYLEYYKTSELYVKVSSVHMSVWFGIYSIEMVNEVRKLHPEFVKDFF